MNLASYRTLGKSGLRISPLTLGTMTFGQEWGWGATPDEAAAMLAYYLERGGNSIDTANVYTKGHSEKIIGDFIRGKTVRRDFLVLSTKFFCNLYPGDPNGGGTSRKTIISSLENSLRRLGTDYVDLYWMHAFDPHTPIEETLSALDDLVRSGKVRYIAVSDTPAWKVAQAQVLAQLRGWSAFIGLQAEYSLLERTAEGELIPMAGELGLGVMSWSPLKEGILSGKYTRENHQQPQSGRDTSRIQPQLNARTYAVLDRLRELSTQTNATPAAIALAWVMGKPFIASTLLGARTLAQLKQNLEALAVALPPGSVAALDAITEPVLNFPVPFLRSGVQHLAQAGTTVNGLPSPVPALLPANDSEVY